MKQLCSFVVMVVVLDVATGAGRAQSRRSARPAAAAGAESEEELARRHYELAEAYKARKSYRAAVDEYLKAYELVRRPALVFNAAQVLWLAEDIEDALVQYARYLELEPAGPGVAVAREQFFRAAEDYFGIGELDTALGHYERYLGIAPGGPHADQARARFAEAADLRWQAGDVVRALMHSERYLLLAPEGPHAAAVKERFFDAAERAEKDADRTAAVARYQRYLDLAPGGPRADQARVRLASLRAELEPAATTRPAAAVESTLPRTGLRAQPPARPWSALVHVALDPGMDGAAAVLGAGVVLGERFEARGAAILGPTVGAYLGGALRLGRVGPIRPLLGAGIPIFVSNGVRLGVRAAAGIEVPTAWRVSAALELGVEHVLNAGWNRRDTALIPMVGLRALL